MATRKLPPILFLCWNLKVDKHMMTPLKHLKLASTSGLHRKHNFNIPTLPPAGILWVPGSTIFDRLEDPKIHYQVPAYFRGTGLPLGLEYGSDLRRARIANRCQNKISRDGEARISGRYRGSKNEALPRTSSKAQVLTDFVIEFVSKEADEESRTDKWKLHVDGASSKQGSEIGIQRLNLQRERCLNSHSASESTHQTMKPSTSL
ncbi:hypothetical protein Bca101_057653 [Brassica carinata]